MKKLKFWFDATDKELVALKNQFAKDNGVELVKFWDDAEHIEVNVYRCSNNEIEVAAVVIRDEGDAVGYFQPYKGKFDKVDEIIWAWA